MPHLTNERQKMLTKVHSCNSCHWDKVSEDKVRKSLNWKNERWHIVCIVIDSIGSKFFLEVGPTPIYESTCFS